MKTTDIDLDFRPASYWDADGLLTAAVANIKGSVRKKEALKLVRAGDVEKLHQTMLLESLEDDTRKFFGFVHPALMGGEYLPDYLPGEVEIARIQMKSTTYDVDVVLARPDGDQIRYRVVDEYEDHFDGAKITTEIEIADRPLSLVELVHLIDTTSWYGEYTGLVFGLAEFHYGGGEGPEEMRDFFEVLSEFYPDLGPLYKDRLEAWCREKQAED
jgi:hypothetical protein